MSPKVYVGTSGWYYDHWLGAFYPEETQSEALLPFYASRFPTVEVNNTFYQLPEATTLEQWRQMTPSGFTFAVKASRYITHMKKLTDPQEPVAKFLSRMEILGDKLGPILFQLPPNWHANPKRLRTFLQALPGDHRYVCEFRDPSWFGEQVYELLREEGVAFCIHDLADQPSPKQITAEFVYVRFHGPQGAYRGSYSVQALAGWAGAISTWRRQGLDVYCYFNNDEAGYAPQDARELQRMVAA
jgi:uncharacterized protein YecE (DUF72 family)